MVENNISAIPVLGPVHETGSWFSMLDAVCALITLAKDQETIPEEALKLPIDKLSRQTSAYKFFALPETATAYDAAKWMVDHDVSRVAVHVEGKPLVLRSIITDSRLLKVLIAAEIPSRQSVFNKSLRDLGLVGNREPIWVSKEAPTIQAFEKMQKWGVRSVAVVEEDFVKDPKIVGMISASDLGKLIAADVAQKIPPLSLLPAELKLPVKDFLRWRDAAIGIQSHPECLKVVYPSTTLNQAMHLLSFHSIHKLYIVAQDGSFHIHGVLSLNDVLKCFVYDEQYGK